MSGLTATSPVTGDSAIDPALQAEPHLGQTRGRTGGAVHKLLKKGAKFGIECEMFRSIQAVIDTGRARDPDAALSTYLSW